MLTPEQVKERIAKLLQDKRELDRAYLQKERELKKQFESRYDDNARQLAELQRLCPHVVDNAGWIFRCIWCGASEGQWA